MSQTDHSPERNGASGLDRLRDELADYLGARAQKLADRAAGKISDTANRLTGVAHNGGHLPRPGLKLLKRATSLPGAAAGKVAEKATEATEKAAGKAVGKAADLTGAVTEKVRGAITGGGRKPRGVKATNMVESIDVGVPLRTAYDRWTQFQDFSDFMKGVESVKKEDEVTSDWRVKIAWSSRTWKAKIEEQVPDKRIAWSSEGPKGTTHGCVSFHELAPRLTRITLVVEYSPSGFFEKTGNLWRAQGRRVRLDLKHFQRHITLTPPDEEFEGWRGEIRDGEVVRSHEDAIQEEEEARGEEPEEEEREEEEPKEGEEEDEGQEDEEDEYEDEEEDEDEDENEDEDEEDEGPER